MKVTNARYGLRAVRVGEASHPASVRLSQRSTQRCVVPRVGVSVSIGSSLAMTQVDSEDSVSDLTPRPGESNILRFRRPLSRIAPHVSEVEVAHNQDARFANRFAVLGLAADEDEDNRLAMPVSPPPESVVDALEFDMTRGDSDSDEVVNSASADSDVENVDLEDWGSEVSGEEIPVPEDPVPDMVDVRLTPTIRVALEWLDTVNLCEEFTRRAAATKSVPHFLRGPHRNAMRLAMEQATHVVPTVFVAPVTPVAPAPKGGNIHKNKLANDSTISRLASGCSFCTQAGSAMRKLLWRCTGSEGGTLNRMRRRDELPVPSLSGSNG